MRGRAIKAVYKAASSPWLTLFLLAYGVLLVFFATIAQTDLPLEKVKSGYLCSFLFFENITGLPMLGGAAIGFLACVNIAAACYRRSKFGLYGLGISLTHMALILLIVSGFLQSFMRLEGVMPLRVGETSDEVLLSDGKRVPLHFKVTLDDFKIENWRGSSIPKSYESTVTFRKGKDSSPVSIMVNAPASFGGWTFYQSSYADGGRVSVLACVKNPARLLPWISVGATFAGMLIIFLPGAARKKRGEKDA